MMMQMSLHQPVPPYQAFQTAAVQLNQAYTDHSWIPDEPIASATTTDAKVPTSIISTQVLNSMELDSAGLRSPEGPNKTFYDHRSSADSAYGSPENNVVNDRGDISPTTKLSPFTSPKASIDVSKRAPHKSFHLPLDARASPRGSVSSIRGQKPAPPVQRPDLKSYASETALKDAFKNDAGIPHFSGPSPHVRRPSFPKNRLSRMDSLSNTFTETCCTTTHHANLERKMSLLEKRIEGLMPALSSLTQAINGLAASFEGGAPTRHVSVQTFKPPYTKSRQPSSSTLAGQGSPLGSIFDINPFTDRRPLGSVSERMGIDPAKVSVRNGSIQSRTVDVDVDDSDDEEHIKRIEAWRNKPRQQSRWDTETESEEDESDSPSAPPVPALPPKAQGQVPPPPPPSANPSSNTVPTMATSPKSVISPRKSSFASAAAAVMRGSIGKKPGVVMRLDQYRPSIALPAMQSTNHGDVPPLPTFCTPSQRYQYQPVPQSAPPHMATFAADLQDSPPPANTLAVPNAKGAAHFPVKPFSLPPTPSGSFANTFPEGLAPSPTPSSVYATPSPSLASVKPFPLAPSPSLTIQSATPPTSVSPHPGTSSVPAPRAAWYFFYGPLIDPALLVELLGLPSTPTLHPARVHGRALKFFGPYPAAVSHRVPLSSTIEGRAWYVPSAQMAAWLRKHEEESFVEVGAEIEFDQGDVERPEDLVLGRMFEWRGDVAALMDGPSI